MEESITRAEFARHFAELRRLIAEMRTEVSCNHHAIHQSRAAIDESWKLLRAPVHGDNDKNASVDSAPS